MRDDVVVAEGLRHGTKEDLVEGRGGDGRVVVHGRSLGGAGTRSITKSIRFQCNRVNEKRRGFNGANYTTFAKT